jgi:hypothetical protein
MRKATVTKDMKTSARKKAATRRTMKAERSRSTATSPTTPSSTSTSISSSSRAVGPGPIIFGAACVVCFVAAVAFLPAHENNKTAGGQQPSIGSQPSTASGRESAGVQAPASSGRNLRAAARSESHQVQGKKTIEPTPPASEPVKAASTALGPAAEPAVKAAPVEPVPAPVTQTVASVTITGCLERDDETFWLSDASGSEAPTSRSWRSGFLKKRPARIELVDAGHALRLTSYVGQRISATGTLVDREMRTRSLHRVSASCG